MYFSFLGGGGGGGGGGSVSWALIFFTDPHVKVADQLSYRIFSQGLEKEVFTSTKIQIVSCQSNDEQHYQHTVKQPCIRAQTESESGIRSEQSHPSL